MGNKNKLNKLEKFLLHEISEERWAYVKINGNETKYQISTNGRVISMYGKLLTPTLDSNKYLQIRIWYNRIGYMRKVHRLVAETFIPNPENKPEVNHINGIKTDNKIKNLEWVTHQENIDHAYLNNLVPILIGENSGNSNHTDKQIHDVCKLLEKKLTSTKISEITGVSKNTINQIRLKKTWTHISKNYNIASSKRVKFPGNIKEIVALEHLKSPKLSLVNLSKEVENKTGYKLSSTTIRNYLLGIKHINH